MFLFPSSSRPVATPLLVLLLFWGGFPGLLSLFPTAVGGAAFAVSATGAANVGRDHDSRRHRTPAAAAPVVVNASPGDADAKTFQDEAATKPVADKYYLLWSPPARKRLALGTSTLFFAHAAGGFLLKAAGDLPANASPASAFGSLAVSIATDVVLPMLAGACCLLQLALNLVSVGCAGFNTHLGPLRPYFVSLLLYLTALTSRLSKHHRPASLASWGAATALRWSLALLPEALHLWNNRESWLPRRLLQPRGTVGSKIQAVVDLEVPTMGCAACINKIDGSLNKLESVVSAKSVLKEAGGSTQVRIAVNTQAELDSALTLLTRTVDEAGFWGSTVESVKVEANGANAKE